jgi:hypothetical protein
VSSGRAGRRPAASSIPCQIGRVDPAAAACRAAPTVERLAARVVVIRDLRQALMRGSSASGSSTTGESGR